MVSPGGLRTLSLGGPPGGGALLSKPVSELQPERAQQTPETESKGAQHAASLSVLLRASSLMLRNTGMHGAESTKRLRAETLQVALLTC
jgi:hypothetical protein